MNLTENAVRDALRQVTYPGFSRDIVVLGAVRDVSVSAGSVEIEIDLGAGNPALAGPLRSEIERTLAGLGGVDSVIVRFRGASRGAPALRMAGAPSSAAAAGSVGNDLIPEVRHVIAVASGKGGVGKSTVAVNLAVALAREGARVGLLDADVYGPSVPLMTGVQEPPRLTPERRLEPFERHGLRIMSIGFLVEPDSAVIWRGPMVMKALEQLLRDVNWGALDYLVVDMPPGTGDAQLTLAQRVRLAGAVIVTTPQDVALADARKGVAMFRTVKVPVLGLIENMSYFECPHCAGRTEIFGHGGGKAEAERLGIPCLGQVPLDPRIRAGGDSGSPIVADDPDSPQARALIEIARSIRAALDDSTAHEGGSIFERFRGIVDGPSD